MTKEIQIALLLLRSYAHNEISDSTLQKILMPFLHTHTHRIHHRIDNHLVTDSDTLEMCWYWPNTNTDTRIGTALVI